MGSDDPFSQPRFILPGSHGGIPTRAGYGRRGGRPALLHPRAGPEVQPQQRPWRYRGAERRGRHADLDGELRGVWEADAGTRQQRGPPAGEHQGGRPDRAAQLGLPVPGHRDRGVAEP